MQSINMTNSINTIAFKYHKCHKMRISKIQHKLQLIEFKQGTKKIVVLNNTKNVVAAVKVDLKTLKRYFIIIKIKM